MTTEPGNAAGSRFQALALSGGGFRGLYTARVLADIEEHFDICVGSRFDLLAGTSVGGILALALAYEIPAARIAELFQHHGAQIFEKRARGIFKANYSSEPLRRLLEKPELFGDRTLGDCRHPVMIPAINFTTGKPVVFKTDHHANLKTDFKLRAVDVALATSAAPLFFPRHVFQSNQYVDGGLFANAPGLLALHEAEMYFGRDIKDVHLMAVGTMSAKFTVDPRKGRGGGILSWGGWNPVKTPQQLFGLAISTQETLADFMLKQRLGDRYCHIDDDLKDEQARAVSLDKATAAATEVLVGSAHERAKWVLGNDGCCEFFSHVAPVPVFSTVRSSSRPLCSNSTSSC